MDSPVNGRLKVDDSDELVRAQRLPRLPWTPFTEAVVAVLLLDGVGDVLEGRIVQTHQAQVRT